MPGVAGVLWRPVVFLRSACIHEDGNIIIARICDGEIFDAVRVEITDRDRERNIARKEIAPRRVEEQPWKSSGTSWPPFFWISNDLGRTGTAADICFFSACQGIE
jgi:hypothetical protein